uniref:THAP domain-containing protein 3-like n=1 Tax=Salmo trutta TaxID=8032 RepID=A0A674BQH8_SALTR
MPKSCSAYNCTNRYSKHTDITFHRFPFSKPTVFRQWLDNICRDDFYPKKHMVICNRKNLLWNAVPTLFTFPPPISKVSLLISPASFGFHVVIFDHSYALSDPCAVKAQLFKALDTNKWLNRRLQMKSQLINKMRFKLKAAHAELSGLRSWHRTPR